MGVFKKIVRGTWAEPAARSLYYSYLKPTRNEPGSTFRDLGKVSDRYDRQTVAVMERVLTEQSNCIDVGCHVGAFLQEMIRICPRGSHFAFEPIPDLYAELRRRYPAVHIYPYALSDEVGSCSFQHVVSSH